MWAGAAAVGTVLAGAARDTGGENTGMDGAAALIAMDGGAAIAGATAGGQSSGPSPALRPGRLPPVTGYSYPYYGYGYNYPYYPYRR